MTLIPIKGPWHDARCDSCKQTKKVQFRGEKSEAFGDSDGTTACKECWEHIEAEARCEKCNGDKYDSSTHTFGGWDYNNDDPIIVCIKKEGILKAFGL